MIKCKTCETLLKEYNNNKQQMGQTEKLIFDGVQGRDVYNITAPFLDHGILVIAGRVEKRDSEDSQVFFFIENNGKWAPKENSKVLNLQDPFFTFINDELIVGGVQTFPHPVLPNALGWRTVFYKGEDINSLEEFLKGPDGMKDLRLVQLQDKRIGIFTRPQGEKGGRGKIGFTIVNTLEDINIEVINEAPLIENQFAEGEWGGTNEIHVCKDGVLGILGHIACFDQSGDRHYYSMSFLFDPMCNQVLSSVKLLAVRQNFLPSAAKRKDLEDVVFSGGLVRRGEGFAVLYAGIGDADAQRIVLEDPFSVN